MTFSTNKDGIGGGEGSRDTSNIRQRRTIEGRKRRRRSGCTRKCFQVDGEQSRDQHGRTEPSVDSAFYIPLIRKANLNKGKHYITDAEVNDEYRLGNGI